MVPRRCRSDPLVASGPVVACDRRRRGRPRGYRSAVSERPLSRRHLLLGGGAGLALAGGVAGARAVEPSRRAEVPLYSETVAFAEPGGRGSSRPGRTDLLVPGTRVLAARPAASRLVEDEQAWLEGVPGGPRRGLAARRRPALRAARPPGAHRGAAGRRRGVVARGGATPGRGTWPSSPRAGPARPPRGGRRPARVAPAGAARGRLVRGPLRPDERAPPRRPCAPARRQRGGSCGPREQVAAHAPTGAAGARRPAAAAARPQHQPPAGPARPGDRAAAAVLGLLGARRGPAHPRHRRRRARRAALGRRRPPARRRVGPAASGPSRRRTGSADRCTRSFGAEGYPRHVGGAARRGGDLPRRPDRLADAPAPGCSARSAGPRRTWPAPRAVSARARAGSRPTSAGPRRPRSSPRPGRARDNATGRRRCSGWLGSHRTAAGSFPEKVLHDGRPAAVAPLAWTAALVVIARHELSRG